MQHIKPRRKPTPFVKTSTVLALLLAWLLVGCETQPQRPPSPPVSSVRVPPLPPSARQPQLPPECSSGCLANLTSERERWQSMLIEAAQPASSAKPSTTPR